jgi:hypothetical protein
LRFNHWQEASGFIEEPRKQDFHEFVQQKETQLRWLLSDDHLTLALGILPEDAANKRWKSFTGEWEAVIPNFKSLVRERERATWLDELTKLCEKRYQDDYRSLGVPGFYRTKLKARKDMAREIRVRIEQELVNEWKVGAKSAWEVSRLLIALNEKLDERLKACDEHLARARHAEEEAQSRVLGNAHKWSSMGLFSKHLLGTPDSLLDAHGVHLQEMYVYRTRAEGWGFAKALLIEVIAEITDLKGEVDRAANTLQQALKKFDVGIQARLSDAGAGDLRQHLIRFYDPVQVKQISRRLVVDEAEQKTQTSRVRAALVEKIGQDSTFALFNQRVTESTFLDVLETVCEDNARIAHQNLVQNPKERLLGVSIIDKLRDRYGADPQELKSYVNELVSRAGNFVTLEPLEIHRAAPGIPVGVPTAVSKFTVILPRAPEQAEFARGLKEALREAKTGDVEIIDSDGRRNEITLVSITNLFPLRYLKPLKFLEEKYRRRIDTGGARARLELHTEGDGNAWPRLFVASSAEVKQQALPYVLLAKALGFIHEGRNPATGAEEVLLLTKDADGLGQRPGPPGQELHGQRRQHQPGESAHHPVGLRRDAGRCRLPAPGPSQRGAAGRPEPRSKPSRPHAAATSRMKPTAAFWRPAGVHWPFSSAKSPDAPWLKKADQPIRRFLRLPRPTRRNSPMASTQSKSGKCSNFGNCATADARATVEVPGGLDFVCNECGKPLLLIDTGPQGGGSKTLLVLGLLLAILLLGGSSAWFFLAGEKSADAHASARRCRPPPRRRWSRQPPPPAPQTEAPARPAHGHCSAADERAGLCRTNALTLFSISRYST